MNFPFDEISSSHQIFAALRVEEDRQMWRQTYQALILVDLGKYLPYGQQHTSRLT